MSADDSPVVVPAEALSPEALLGLVDAFILREGTDYGHEEPTLEAKRSEVLGQIRRGEVSILFTAETEGVELVLTRDLPAELRP